MDVMNIEGVKANDGVREALRGMGPQPLYDIPGFGEGTLGQLVMFVTLRQWDLALQNAANLANALTRDSDLLEAMGLVMDEISDGKTDYDDFVSPGDYVFRRAGARPTLREFLLLECEMNEEDLPFGSLVDDINNRQALIDKMQYKVQNCITESEFRQTDLQLALNLANTYSATCSNILKRVLASANSVSANLLVR